MRFPPSTAPGGRATPAPEEPQTLVLPTRDRAAHARRSTRVPPSPADDERTRPYGPEQLAALRRAEVPTRSAPPAEARPDHRHGAPPAGATRQPATDRQVAPLPATLRATRPSPASRAPAPASLARSRREDGAEPQHDGAAHHPRSAAQRVGDPAHGVGPRQEPPHRTWRPRAVLLSACLLLGTGWAAHGWLTRGGPGAGPQGDVGTAAMTGDPSADADGDTDSATPREPTGTGARVSPPAAEHDAAGVAVTTGADAASAPRSEARAATRAQAGAVPAPPSARLASGRLAEGDHAAALAAYRALQTHNPKHEVYGVIARVLAQRLRAHCATAGAGAADCSEVAR